MQIFPAIDLCGGEVVRLLHGDYDQKTVYGQNPAAVVREFKQNGASCLHVVDLDGAKDATLANFDAVAAIVREGGLFIEVGGGIRTEERIQTYLQLGVNRVILGTAAVTNLPFLQQMVDKYGDKIAVGVDAKDGLVSINGWKEITNTPSVAFCEKLRDMGVSTVIYTDISKDGGLSGTNLQVYRQLAQIEGLGLVASGGVSFEPELLELKSMGVDAAIVGKAIYTGKLKLARIIALTQ